MTTIVFDFDGTIADSFVYVLRFLQKEAGIKQEPTKKEQSHYRGLSLKDIALKLGIPLWRMPFLYFKGRRAVRGHVEHVKPFAGIPEVIRELHNNGYHLCIISANSSKNVRHFLKHYQLDGYFNSVRGGAGLFGKVTPIKQLLRRYKTLPQDCWYVGDEVQDLASAKAAGVKSLAVTWGFASPAKLAEHGPAALAKTPEELVKILENPDSAEFAPIPQRLNCK